MHRSSNVVTDRFASCAGYARDTAHVASTGCLTRLHEDLVPPCNQLPLVDATTDLRSGCYLSYSLSRSVMYNSATDLLGIDQQIQDRTGTLDSLVQLCNLLIGSR
jgi:hypothetical protein